MLHGGGYCGGRGDGDDMGGGDVHMGPSRISEGAGDTAGDATTTITTTIMHHHHYYYSYYYYYHIYIYVYIYIYECYIE